MNNPEAILARNQHATRFERCLGYFKQYVKVLFDDAMPALNMVIGNSNTVCNTFSKFFVIEFCTN